MQIGGQSRQSSLAACTCLYILIRQYVLVLILTISHRSLSPIDRRIFSSVRGRLSECSNGTSCVCRDKGKRMTDGYTCCRILQVGDGNDVRYSAPVHIQVLSPVVERAQLMKRHSKHNQNRLFTEIRCVHRHFIQICCFQNQSEMVCESYHIPYHIAPITHSMRRTDERCFRRAVQNENW